MTELTSYNYKPTSSAFGVAAVLAFSSVVLWILLMRPDGEQSALRCQYAASVQGSVFQIASTPQLNTTSELVAKWREQHLELYDLFMDDQDDVVLSEYFQKLSSAYYTIDGLMQDSKAPGLTAAAKAYADAAERIFTWETARLVKEESRHVQLSLLLLVLALTAVFVLYRILVVRSFVRMETVLFERADQLRAREIEQGQLRGFLHQTLSGFHAELDGISNHKTSELTSDLRKRMSKLYRSTHSALAYTRELIREEQRVVSAFSLEALLADVAEYLRTQTELNASHFSYSVASSMRSVMGDPDLIGPLISQACICILEMEGVRGVSVVASAEAADQDLVKVSFVICPTTDRADATNQALADAFARDGQPGDFGTALIDGLLRTVGGKYYLDGSVQRSLCVQLVCKRYDDEVSAENNQQLEGRKVFVVDFDVERLRVLVRQLSGYGVQATPFNSQQPILDNLGALRKFDMGIVVNRETNTTANTLMDAIRKDREFEKLPVIGLYPESDTPSAGVVWDALLTGQYTESDVVAALRFCLPNASAATGSGDPTSSTQPTALQRARR